jgi:peptidoglycan hydrolase-like protein with peptidoglycan-binding domain
VPEADSGAAASKSKELRGALPAGSRLRSYELISVLGQGGFGITYRARDTTLNRDVAIKEYLPISLALREGGSTVVPRSTDLVQEFVWGRDRFLDEARTLATLGRAPAVVRVHDFLEANGTAYIVMELALGETLEHRIACAGPLSPQAVERVLHPLLDGLKQVHSVGYLHRDIKPANIILDADGNPTLIDFGAARAAIAGRTAAMTAIFTPGYAAAEQFTSANQGPWTDIYGLSATLYHAITGVTPPSAVERMLDDQYEPIAHRAGPGFSSGLLNGIDAGLSVRALDRPQSIDDWRKVVDLGAAAALAGSAPTQIMGKPAAAAPGQRQAARKRGAIRAAAAAAFLLVLAGGGYGLFVATRPPTVDAAVQSLTAEELTRALEERRKADVLAEEKKKLEEEARRKAEADAEAKHKADEALLAAQQQRQKAEEELAKLKLDMEARQRAEAAQREQAATDAQRALDEATRKNKAEAEIAALRKAEDDAKAKAATDAAAKQAADEEAQRKAELEATASRQAEEDARKTAAGEAEAKRQADEALAKAQADRQRADEEAARQKAELEAGQTAEAAKAKADADADAKAQAAAKAQAEGKVKSTAETEAKAKAEADAQAKAEADAAAQKKAAEAVEAALKLAPVDRQRLQVALTSLGFAINGSDGVFGPRSRGMIAAWQKGRNLPSTGFLNGAQQQALLKEGAAAISQYDQEQKKAEEDKKKAEGEAKKKAEDEAKKKAEEEAKAKAAAPSVAPTAAAPAPTVPTPSASPVSVYDGTYSGSLPSSTSVRTIAFRVVSGSGSGTINISGCNPSPISITISPAGDVTGAGDGFTANCGAGVAISTSVGLGPIAIQGRADGTRLNLVLKTNLTNIRVTLTRSSN